MSKRWKKEFSVSPIDPLEQDVIIEYRQELLDTLNKMKPEILEELYFDIYPSIGRLISPELFLKPAFEVPKEITEVLSQWVIKHNLYKIGRYEGLTSDSDEENNDKVKYAGWNYDWIIEVTVNTMILWKRQLPHESEGYPKEEVKLEWYLYGMYEVYNPLGEAFIEPLYSYLYREARGKDFEVNLFQETKEANLKRIKENVNRLIEKYFDEVDELINDFDSFKKLPPKRKLEHFTWLVRYQIQGWNYREIADEYEKTTNREITEEMTKKGIKKAAHLAGIKFDTAGKVGRPKKNKN